jgi:oxepin-CoA hydrolase/3-oxo-5,6-dehydrosuberyl-CoA semialdehyde dehydrogenase
MLTLQNYTQDRWHAPSSGAAEFVSAVTAEPVARGGSAGLDFGAMARHARTVGGPALRAMTFHERARMVKALAEAVMARKDELYALSYLTGATKGDSWIDIDGGAGTFFSVSSKTRREVRDGHVLVDGDPEILGRAGTFLGQHIYTPLHGVAVHINAFNFPVWGMMEKLAPTLIAGVPAIVKPASATSYLAEAAFRVMVETGLLPPGAVQLIIGSVGDLFDHLTGQDVISFTGSADTAQKLQSHPVIAREAVRFISERDSLNACVLGPDAEPGTPEFDLFTREIVREMTVKAGQKCTAIRRAFAPAHLIDAAEAALAERLGRVVVGDPRVEGVTMGALASAAQLADVRGKVRELSATARIAFGDPQRIDPVGEVARAGFFMSPILMRQDSPWASQAVHDTEPFGPVSTLMPYRDLDDSIALVNRGQGSLVMSLFTHSPEVARAVVLGSGAFHGRMLICDRDCAKESTGHGSPLPVLVHGGPGRAGGGEELGGVRGLQHYMQRTALQGSPAVLTATTGRWMPGGPTRDPGVHPFRLRLGELQVGDTHVTREREVTLADIEHFAAFTGDNFYAHMDEAAAARNPLFGTRVAHGYLVLSFAAGLFVDPDEGPVLANYGLEGLRFVKPVKPGDRIKVQLTVRSKQARDADRGEVRWAAIVTNQDGEVVAAYDLLTQNAV